MKFILFKKGGGEKIGIMMENINPGDELPIDLDVANEHCKAVKIKKNDVAEGSGPTEIKIERTTGNNFFFFFLTKACNVRANPGPRER